MNESFCHPHFFSCLKKTNYHNFSLSPFLTNSIGSAPYRLQHIYHYSFQTRKEKKNRVVKIMMFKKKQKKKQVDTSRSFSEYYTDITEDIAIGSIFLMTPVVYFLKFLLCNFCEVFYCQENVLGFICIFLIMSLFLNVFLTFTLDLFYLHLFCLRQFSRRCDKFIRSLNIHLHNSSCNISSFLHFT